MLYRMVDARHVKRSEKEKILKDTRFKIIHGWGYEMKKEHNVWMIYLRLPNCDNASYVVLDRKEARALRQFIRKREEKWGEIA